MNPKSNAKQFSQRLIFIYLIIFTFFFVIIKQLWHLQIVQGEYYREIAKKNGFRKVLIPAPRGRIFDRRGRILVDNRPRFDLIATIEDIMDVTTPEKEAALISKVLKYPCNEILRKITDKTSHAPFEPSTIITDLSIQDVIKISEKDYLLPGIDLRILPVRHYVHEKSACHILGYTGKISESEFEKLKEQARGYTITEDIGKVGAESTFQYFLRGIPGERQVQVNSFGHLQKVFGELKPIKGFDVYLTLDIKIQKIIENAFEGRNGAAVVMEVDTGNIIALVSQPGFDPNIFASGNSEKIQNYFLAPHFPLLNRVISAELAPGSTFKPIVALGALNCGFIKETTSVFCNGIFQLKDISFKCWKKWGHGETNITKAIEQSCNVFFYHIGKEMGYEPIYEIGRQFRLGNRTGIPLKGEKPGILPCEEWKKKRFKIKEQQKWRLGDSINYAIGQGYILVTPIQMACVTAAIASGGFLPTPNILYKVVDHQGFPKFMHRPSTPLKINIEQSNLDKVRIGMFNVIHVKYGTGRKARVMGLRAAGKTGTAQVMTRKGETQNAWFICFAPFENPKIALTIMIEGGLSGGESAAPIAKKILSAYFNIPIPSEGLLTPSIAIESESLNDVTETTSTNVDEDMVNMHDNEDYADEQKIPVWDKIKNVLNRK